MGIWLYISLSLLLQIPVTLSLIALAVVVQRTSQAAFLRTLDNREKQLAFFVQSMITQLGELSSKVTLVQQDAGTKTDTLQTSVAELSRTVSQQFTRLEDSLIAVMEPLRHDHDTVAITEDG